MTDRLGALASALEGRYQVGAELGAGGMATVYGAADFKHRRQVAIKVLRPELAAVIGRDRFLREIELAAGLQHPHILGLIDSGDANGVLYYIMPFVEGESLRRVLEREGAFPVARALRLGGQVAEALDYAHRRGVVHRDIKPENILLQDGQATVADFGIALALRETGSERLTATGFSLGTPAYMSPEQVTGTAEVDGRSDQYSLACVVYELLTGAPPFAGATAQAVMVKHVTEAAPMLPPSVPGAVGAAIVRAMAKDPAARFPTAAEFAAALTAGAVPGAAPSSLVATPAATIVVLPFEDASPNPEDSFFATGLTDEVISDLSKIKAIRAISRNSSMKLKGTTKDLKTIGRELKVRYALTGSVRRAGEALRITTELVDIESDTPVWGEKYSGTVADVFVVQEKIARQIVDALQVTVTPAESRRLVARPDQDLGTYEALVKARDLFMRYDVDSFLQARTILHAELARTGDRPDLLSWLGTIYATEAVFASPPDLAAGAIADGFIRKALALAPGDTAACYAKATLEFWLGLGCRAALPWLRRALAGEAHPDYMNFAAYCMALAGTDFERAVWLVEESVARDPATEKLKGDRCWVLLLTGQTDRALEAVSQVETSQSSPIVAFQAAVTLLLGGRSVRNSPLVAMMQSGSGVPREWLETVHLVDRALTAGPNNLTAAPSRALLEMFERYGPIAPMMIAGYYALAGQRDHMLQWMELAIDRGATNDRWWGEWYPLVAPYRDDPEFQALVAKARQIRESEPV